MSIINFHKQRIFDTESQNTRGQLKRKNSLYTAYLAIGQNKR